MSTVSSSSRNFFAIMKKTILVLLINIFFINFQTSAQQVSKPRGGNPGTWRVLGTTHAHFSADHDVLVLQGPYDYFRRLKFKVTDAPLNIGLMIVRYDDSGAPEKVDVRYNVPQGGESRVIDLKGGKRKLRSVEFWYDTKGVFNGGADVTLLGMK